MTTDELEVSRMLDEGCPHATPVESLDPLAWWDKYAVPSQPDGYAVQEILSRLPELVRMAKADRVRIAELEARVRGEA